MREKITAFLEKYHVQEYALKFYQWEYFWESCGIAAAVCFFFVFYIYSKAKNAPLKISQSDAGSVTVARRVLDDLVYTACINLGINSRPAVRYKIKRKQINMYIRIQLGQGQLINDKTQALQDYLYRELRDSLGIIEVGNIDIEVTGAAAKIRKPEPVEPPVKKESAPESDASIKEDA